MNQKILPYLTVCGILLLAVLARLPGVFWGVDSLYPLSMLSYHLDELSLSRFAVKIINHETLQSYFYPQGFPYQLSLLFRFLGFEGSGRMDEQITIIGRFWSVLYGVATIGVVYAITRELFSERRIAIYSAIFLTLSNLHVTHSHFATVDAGVVFYFYAVILMVFYYARTTHIVFLGLACIFSALAISMKVALYTMLPILYVLIIQRIKLKSWLLLSFLIVGVVYGASGGLGRLQDVVVFYQNVQKDVVQVIPNHQDWQNCIVHLMNICVGLTLPVFCLMLTAVGRWKCFLKSLRPRHGVRDVFFVLIFPVLMYGLCIYSYDTPFARHILPMIPFAVILAAFGFHRLFGVFRQRLVLLICIIVYLMMGVISMERYYVRDTRQLAEVWINTHIPRGSTISLSPKYGLFRNLPAKYRVDWKYAGEYWVLTEGNYGRYLRTRYNPLEKFPPFEKVFHGQREEFDRLQPILKGESEYRLIHRERIQPITPEHFVFVELWGTYQDFLGEVLILSRKKQYHYKDPYKYY